MATGNVVLPPHQEQVIHDLVQSGRYQNASDVTQETLKYIFCDHHGVNVCLHEPMYPFAGGGGKDLTSSFVEVHQHAGPAAVRRDAGIAEVGRQDGRAKPGIAIAEHE